MKTITLNNVVYACPFADALPPLKPEERAALKENIRQHGIQVAVQIDEQHNIIDGHNRLDIAVELGLTDVPMKVVSGLTEDQKRDLAEDLNLHRRQLTREQIRTVLARRLKANPDQSDRAIAAGVGVDGKTVASVRKEMESTAEIPQSKTRTDSRGRKRPVSSEGRSKAPADKPTPEATAQSPSDQEIADMSPCSVKNKFKEPIGKRKGIELAHEAINCLSRISDDDQLWDRGFQIVLNWVKRAIKARKKRKLLQTLASLAGIRETPAHPAHPAQVEVEAAESVILP